MRLCGWMRFFMLFFHSLMRMSTCLSKSAHMQPTSRHERRRAKDLRNGYAKSDTRAREVSGCANAERKHESMQWKQAEHARRVACATFRFAWPHGIANRQDDSCGPIFRTALDCSACSARCGQGGTIEGNRHASAIHCILSLVHRSPCSTTRALCVAGVKHGRRCSAPGLKIGIAK
jgi:hypothetical protein